VCAHGEDRGPPERQPVIWAARHRAASPCWRRRTSILLLLLLVLLAGRVNASPPDPLADARAAADAVLACARPDGGWTYVCNPASGPHGVVTRLLIRARQIGSWLGGARWDVLVVRSPGTPAAGIVMLDAWKRWGDPRYLDAARRAGDILLAAQLGSGGWASELPVRGASMPVWFRWLNHEAALDDDVTSGATRFLLALWRATGDDRYRAGARRGLDLVRGAQLANGAWPLTWRPGWLRWLSPSFEDGPSTNDAATAGPIEALLQGSAMLDNREDLLAARRGGDWLLGIQGAPQAGWAQQYDAAGRPGPGRRFEPAGFATWESREMLDALVSLARVTGERRYCRAVGPAVRWFYQSALAPGCWARLYAPGTNAPLFVDRDGRPVATPADARRSYSWTGDFGIPGFLATLGLGSDGRRLAPGAPRPPVRLIGDPGACPGEPPIEAAPDDENPRRRIVRAAVLLQRLEPGPASPCARDAEGE
jgi:Pectic acid lyase